MECILNDMSNIRIYRPHVTTVEENQSNTGFLHWARSHSKLKVVSAGVPAGIFPVGIYGVLYDVKVFVKHGPDDSVYDSNADIRARVARGNCLLELSNCNETGVYCVTYALKKFTGGLGDDDDKDKGDEYTWKKYFTKPLDEATHVVCTRKANGEAAHLSAIQIRDQIYVVAGSKNVHMILKSREDIVKYEGDRYRVASEVAEAIMNLLDSMTQQQRTRLLEFLCEFNVTAIFEILNPDHQHVENLSYLKKPKLKFITWTSNEIDAATNKCATIKCATSTYATSKSSTSKSSLCCLPPHTGIEIARELGLSTVDYDKITVEQVQDRMRTVRLGYGYEGEVLYFLDQHDDVIGLLKKKTIWYIICRAIREKVRHAAYANFKNKADFTITKSHKQIKSRLKEIQCWLNLDDAAVTTWIDLGCTFLEFAIHKSDQKTIQPDKLTDLFPIHWTEFLKENPDKTDNIEVKWDEPGGSDD